MASTIKLKNGSGAPTTGDLVQGEPALDLTNKRLYTENASGVVIEVGTNPSTIDINAGTIDGTVIGGTTPAAVTGTTITGTSFVSSGDMTFEDNDKAVFGNGSDLRIYHTGSHSTIENIGTGHLQIHSTDFRLRNSAGTESMILANADGNVQLYYDNALKLATTATGIDVTGTVTADGLTVDGSIATIQNTSDGTALRLSSTQNSAHSLTTPFGEVQFYSGDTSSPGAGVRASIGGYPFDTAASGGGVIKLQTSDSASLKTRLDISNNGDISFFEDTGTTAKFFWDASTEFLGIGTTSPLAHLDVKSDTGSVGFNYGAISSPSRGNLWYDTDGSGWKFDIGKVQSGSFTSQVTIQDNGNVGIGTTSPSSIANYVVVETQGDTTTTGGIYYTSSSDSSQKAHFYVGGGVGYLGTQTNHPLAFTTNNTERMRIDTSGNLLVGCTSLPSASVKGAAFLGNANQGRLYVSADSTAARDLAYFINPNGVIGTITTTSSSTAYNTSSDERLKENITDANDAGDKIDAIKVRQYDWKTDGSHQDYGMVAQELMTVAPEAVSGDPESDDMMGVDYSKLVPMMLKEIQSLRARVAQLEGAN
jgi:hypothetical protein